MDKYEAENYIRGVFVSPPPMKNSREIAEIIINELERRGVKFKPE